MSSRSRARSFSSASIRPSGDECLECAALEVASLETGSFEEPLSLSGESVVIAVQDESPHLLQKLGLVVRQRLREPALPYRIA